MTSTAVTAMSGDDAVDNQEAAARKGNFDSMAMYQQARTDLKPWMEAGAKALGDMQGADYMKDFSMADFQQDPGYAFRMQQGQQALERSAAAKGGLNSGGTLKALTQYGQDMGSQEYGNAYNRFNADRDRRFGRLSNISGMGQSSAAGLTGATMHQGDTMNQNAIGVGDAQAANSIRKGEAINKGISNGMQMMSMFCDRRLKTEIKAIDPAKLAELKKCLKAYSYKYINAEHGEGERIGVMAQDLQKSELGRSIVFTDESGNLKIDIAKGLNLALAALAVE